MLPPPSPPVAERQRGDFIMQVAWPAFLAAFALESVVFAVVDPQEVHWASDWSRQGLYTAAFFFFWGVCAASSALTVWLARPRKDML